MDSNDICIVGTGTSLDNFDFDQLRVCRTIALNHALRYVPAADYWVASDLHVTARYATTDLGRTTPVLYRERQRDHGLARAPWWWHASFFDCVLDPDHMLSHPRALYFVATVATAALSLAWRLGARRVYLLGVDGYRLGEHKYFYDTNLPGDRIASGSHKSHAAALDRLAGWLATRDDAPDVVLLSPDSPITSFPRRALSSCFATRSVVQTTE